MAVWAPPGSRITAATWCSSSSRWMPARSLCRATRVVSRVCRGMPADIGAENGALTAAASPSETPWK